MLIENLYIMNWLFIMLEMIVVGFNKGLSVYHHAF